MERTTQFVGNGDPGEPDPGKAQGERAISFGQPIATPPFATRRKSEEQEDFKLQRQGTLELQKETERVQVPKPVAGKEGSGMCEVDVETGNQGTQLHIWDKFKLKKGASSREYNV